MSRMMPKIRSSMRARGDRYLLWDMIEIDDAYVEPCMDHKYRDEFCYKLDWRYFGECLLIAVCCSNGFRTLNGHP